MYPTCWAQKHFENFNWGETLWPPINAAFSARANTSYLFKAKFNSCSSALRCQQTSAKTLYDWMSTRGYLQLFAMMNCPGRNVCVSPFHTDKRENITTWWHLFESTSGISQSVWISMSQAERGRGRQTRVKRQFKIRRENGRWIASYSFVRLFDSKQDTAKKPEEIQFNLQIMRIVQLWQRHTLSAELEPVKPDFRLTLLNKHFIKTEHFIYSQDNRAARCAWRISLAEGFCRKRWKCEKCIYTPGATERTNALTGLIRRVRWDLWLKRYRTSIPHLHIPDGLG